MKNKFKYLLIGLSVFFFFVFFSYLVHKDLFTQFDFNNTVRFQDHVSRRLDGLFSTFSIIGAFEVTTLILLAILIIKRKVVLGFFALLLYGLIHFIEIFGKVFVNHLPPPHFMLRTEKLLDLPQFYVRAENSYPSGHSARTAFISIILAILISKTKKLSRNQKIVFYSLLVVFDLTMFISRVYLGEHWSSDVIGGLMLGLALGLISSVFA